MNSRRFEEDLDPNGNVHWTSESYGQVFYNSEHEHRYDSLAEAIDHTGNILTCVQYEQVSERITIGAYDWTFQISFVVGKCQYKLSLISFA